MSSVCTFRIPNWKDIFLYSFEEKVCLFCIPCNFLTQPRSGRWRAKEPSCQDSGRGNCKLLDTFEAPLEIILCKSNMRNIFLQPDLNVHMKWVHFFFLSRLIEKVLNWSTSLFPSAPTCVRIEREPCATMRSLKRRGRNHSCASVWLQGVQEQAFNPHKCWRFVGDVVSNKSWAWK